MAGIEFDTSDISALAVDLGKAGRKATIAAMKVVAKHAQKVKEGMAADAGGHPRFRHLPAAVDYTLRGLDAEIGFNRSKRQGNMAHIAVFGASGSGPLFDHTAAQRRELPATERFLADIGVESLW